MKSSFRTIITIIFLGLLVTSECTLKGILNRRVLQTSQPWAPNTAFATGSVVTYQGNSYQCIQGHTSLVGWEPPVVPALWGLIGASSGTNSTSTTTTTSNSTTSSNSTSSNNNGSSTSSNNSTSSSNSTSTSNSSSTSTGNNNNSGSTTTSNSTSTSSNNSTSSSSNSGSTSTSSSSSNTIPGQWTVGVTYSIGTIVMYNNILYSCTFAHTSQADWTPDAVPALWSKLAVQCTVVPNAPSPIAFSASPNSASLSWSAVALPVPCPTLSYAIYVNGAQVGVSNTASYIATGLTPATTYQIGVASVDLAGTSSPTVVSVTTSPNPCTVPPSMPSGLAASSITSYNLQLSWVAAVDSPALCSAVSFNIYQNGVLVGNSTGSSYTVQPLAASKAYSFTIQAVGLGGQSAQTGAITVTTAAPPPKVFAPYIDMGLSNNNMSAIGAAAGVKMFSMAFVIGAGCQANWFGAYNIPGDTVVGPMIKQFGAQNVIVSFGGAIGVELAQACSTPAATQAQYQAVIDAYGVTQLDFDIEGAAIAMPDIIDRRNKALAGLQAANPGLTISYTLPVLPNGLTQDGVNLLANTVANGVNVAVINIMAMDYGGLYSPSAMGANAISAANATLAQMASVGMKAKLGITPMIGLNDVAPENFSLADAQTVLDYANSNPQVSRLAMWSIGRDNGNCPGGITFSCSGVSQSLYAYANVFNKYSS